MLLRFFHTLPQVGNLVVQDDRQDDGHQKERHGEVKQALILPVGTDTPKVTLHSLPSSLHTDVDRHRAQKRKRDVAYRGTLLWEEARAASCLPGDPIVQTSFLAQ